MKVSGLFLFLIICNFIHQSQSADILFFHNVASYSHLVATWPLAEALSNRGHKVTYMSPYYSKHPNPNITEFVPAKLAKFSEDIQSKEFDIGLRVQKKMDSLIDIMYDYSYDSCEALYASPDFNAWLSKHTKFDLVIIDSCFAHECGVGLAYKLSAKYIYFSTVVTNGYEFDALGYHPESSAVPVLGTDPPIRPFGFLTRVSNALNSLRWRFWHALYSVKIHEYIRNSLEIPDMPFVGDLVRNAGLVLYTGDVISDYPRALPPNYVNVAGIHCKESNKELPEDIKNFLSANDLSDDGFIYISLGSLVVSSNLPGDIKQVFFETIKSFPKLKFLWKWNGDFPENIPSNLFLRKWFPQLDLLANQGIRGFVTQTGRPSTLEAIYNGVSLISFPILGDQDFNANRLAEIGASIKLEIGTVTVEELTEAINKTVYDPKIKRQMRKYQRIFRDRPMSPVDTAVWWTEYVLRTEDMSHLRAAGADQFWFVRRQIDVWAFLSVGLFVATVFQVTIITKMLRKLLNTNAKVKMA